MYILTAGGKVLWTLHLNFNMNVATNVCMIR